MTLDKYFVHPTLRLAYNYNGPTEIGGLILLPEYLRACNSVPCAARRSANINRRRCGAKDGTGSPRNDGSSGDRL